MDKDLDFCEKEKQAIETIEKIATISEKFIIKIKRDSNFNNKQFWGAVNFLTQECDFGVEII
jgi:hypothetical protein